MLCQLHAPKFFARFGRINHKARIFSPFGEFKHFEPFKIWGLGGTNRIANATGKICDGGKTFKKILKAWNIFKSRPLLETVHLIKLIAA